MSTDINVILKKKIFDESTDSEVGHIVYDNTTKRVYVGGILFGSEIDNAEINSDGYLVLTKIDGTTVIEKSIVDKVANASEPLVVPSSTSLTAQVRNITLSTEEPSGGNPGDIWIQYEA